MCAILCMDILKALYLYGRACPRFGSCNVSRANVWMMMLSVASHGKLRLKCHTILMGFLRVTSYSKFNDINHPLEHRFILMVLSPL